MNCAVPSVHAADPGSLDCGMGDGWDGFCGFDTVLTRAGTGKKKIGIYIVENGEAGARGARVGRLMTSAGMEWGNIE